MNRPVPFAAPVAGFTAITCGTCLTEEHDLELLRETIRRSVHGMLVRVHCPLGRIYCKAREGSAHSGWILIVQPCTAGRSPVGSAVIVGPIRTADDLVAVTGWLETDPLDGSTLPARLRRIQHPRQQSIQN
ncbi:hypothetical protein GCM10011609_28800 [Lentzea pudingi]|uniref:Uncharacterized protein n=1 Tax=Lentzea pudingi TaxID=1789439 RepID=A0ABQ2HWD0_9PSEU|nr:hypothetical protein GCM10011609_28800 [Lentzea pudingi]